MEVKWLIDKNERTLDFYIKQLDFSLPYAEERMALLHKILDSVKVVDENGEVVEVVSYNEWLKGYVGSKGFSDQQVKTKDQFRAEDDPFCKGLERIADFVIFPKFDNQEDEQNKISRKDTLSKYKEKKNQAENFYEAEGASAIEKAVTQKSFKVTTKPVVTEKDLRDFSYLAHMQHSIDALGIILGYGKGFTAADRELLQENIKVNQGNKYLFLLKKVYAELKSESLTMKEQLRGTIYFKHLNAGDVGAVLTLDADTGYFLPDSFEGTKVDRYDSTMSYGAGDYVSITENKIDFNNPEHVYQVLNLYGSLKQNCYDKPDGEIWHIVNTIEELIDNTEFSETERKILELKIDGLTGVDISKELKELYKIEISDKRVSQVYKDIPNKLVETHKQLYEDWLYTYKVKGQYKCCSKCGVNKLATTKYFSPQKKGKFGLKATCRECR